MEFCEAQFQNCSGRFLENPQIGRYVREVAIDTLEDIPFDTEDHDTWTEEKMDEEMKRHNQQLDLFNTAAL